MRSVSKTKSMGIEIEPYFFHTGGREDWGLAAGADLKKKAKEKYSRMIFWVASFLDKINRIKL